MTRVILLVLSLVMLTNCGIRKPLIPPKEIPAYEAKVRKKRAGLEADDNKSDPSNLPANAPPTGAVIDDAADSTKTHSMPAMMGTPDKAAPDTFTAPGDAH